MNFETVMKNYKRKISNYVSAQIHLQETEKSVNEYFIFTIL